MRRSYPFRFCTRSPIETKASVSVVHTAGHATCRECEEAHRAQCITQIPGLGAAVVGQQAVYAVHGVGRAVIQYLAQGGGQVLGVRRRAALD